MLRIKPIKNAVDYHKQSLTRGDYYTERGEVSGEWKGKGSQILGLSGIVTTEEFTAVCENRHPFNDSKLTPRMDKKRRQAYDFNFSVPKSVSLQEAITGDTRIINSIIDSMNETMVEVEKNFQTRVRTNGSSDANRITGNITYAYFLHKNSRPMDGFPDPHLHTHTVVMNLTFDEVENKWKAGQFGDKKANAPYYQAIFDSKLANKLIKLGFEIRKVPDSFEILQYDRPTIDLFSRRTKEIEQKIKDLNITNEKDKDELGSRTRNSKNNNYTQAELKQKYVEILGQKKVDLFKSLIKPDHQTLLLQNRPIIVDADHFKKVHGDYENDNHHIYGKMTKELFLEALKIPEIDKVIYTAGGSGSGKSEIILKRLDQEDFKGIIVDCTLANYNQAIDNINRSLAAGKKVEIRGVVPDLQRAYGFVLQREAETGRRVPLHTFLEKHFGFMESFPKIIQHFENNKNVKFVLYDRRDLNINKRLNKNTSILDLFKGLKYDKSELENKLKQIEDRYGFKIQTTNRETSDLSSGNPISSTSESKNYAEGIGRGDSGQNLEHRIRDEQQVLSTKQDTGSFNANGDFGNSNGGRDNLSSIDLVGSKANYWLNYNLEKNFERQSTLSEQTLIAQTLMEGIGQTDLQSVQSAIRELTQNGILITDNISPIELGKLNNLSKSITTQVILSEEKQLVEYVNNQINKFTPFNFNYNSVLTKNTFLNDNQKQVVKDVLESRDGVILIQGLAGTGKTTVLKEIEKGINAQNKQILALAPTLKAVDILKEDFSNSVTIQGFLNDNKTEDKKVKGFFGNLFGAKTEIPNSYHNLPRGSILFVDEASLVSYQRNGQTLLKIKIRGV